MSHILVGSLAAGLGGTFLETKFQPAIVLGLGLREGGGGSSSSAELCPAYGLTPLILSGMSFWVLMHGFLVVNKARSKAIEQAKKDGEKDVDERYAYPNLYAQGTSKHAKAFNCAQRSHQQIFETFPQMCLLSMVGAVTYPITTAVTLTTYCVGRYTMSMGYANEEGDAAKRYSHPLAKYTWYGYISTIVVASVSSVSILLGKPAI